MMDGSGDPKAQTEIDSARTTELPGFGASRDTIALNPYDPTPIITPEDDVAAGEILVGQKGEYELVERIGKGGFGAVYVAKPLTERCRWPAEVPIPERVAVKRFTSPSNMDRTQFVKRELSAAIALNHSRIPRIYDWRISERTSFLVMQYYPFGSLGRNLEAATKLTIDEGWRLLQQLLEALIVTHRAGLLHLDIKPSNVLHDGEGGYVLADFGIAQAAFAPEDVIPVGMGTFGFRAPEQANGDSDNMGMRTDLYGAGATVWAMMAGLDLTRKFFHLTEPPEGYGLPRLTTLRPDCPPEFDRILMSLLAVDPGCRPGSAAEVLATLESHGGSSDLPFVGASIGLVETASPEILDQLLDPIWRAVFERGYLKEKLVRYRPGDVLIEEGAADHRAFLLLSGSVEILRGGVRLATEHREGTVMGEVAALAGVNRTSSVHALDDVLVAVLNAAELEILAARIPALAVRLMKTLAERLARESRTPV